MRGSGGYAGGGIRKDVRNDAKESRGYSGPYSHLSRSVSMQSAVRGSTLPPHYVAPCVGVAPSALSAPSAQSALELQMLRLRELVLQSETRENVVIETREVREAVDKVSQETADDIIIESSTAESSPSEHPAPDPNQSQPILSLDLHFFDGKVETAVSWIMPDILRVKNIDPEVKRYGISQLRDRITSFPFQIPEAIQSFDVLSSSHAASNTDPITNVNAYDLLYILYERVVLDGKEDCMDTLITQLSDMQTGMCVQGRVTRLLQVIVMFDNFV